MWVRTLSGLTGAVALIGALLAINDTVLAEPFYQGPKKCVECHETEYKVWEDTKHFKSLRTVHKDKKAKAIAKAVGGSKRMKKNEVCTLCHYTLVQKDANAKAKVKAGPSCESCHGASSDWFDIHNDYGGPSVKRDGETPEHKAGRLQKARDSSMVWSF